MLRTIGCSQALPLTVALFLIAGCAGGARMSADDSTPPATTEVRDSFAFRSLEGAAIFAADKVGFAGMQPRTVDAIRTLVTRPDARAVLIDLFDRATPAGKLYALAGLVEVDRAAFEERARSMRDDRTPIEGMIGCVVHAVPAATWIDEFELPAGSDPGTSTMRDGIVRDWQLFGDDWSLAEQREWFSEAEERVVGAIETLRTAPRASHEWSVAHATVRLLAPVAARTVVSSAIALAKDDAPEVRHLAGGLLDAAAPWVSGERGIPALERFSDANGLAVQLVAAWEDRELRPVLERAFEQPDFWRALPGGVVEGAHDRLAESETDAMRRARETGAFAHASLREAALRALAVSGDAGERMAGRLSFAVGFESPTRWLPRGFLVEAIEACADPEWGEEIAEALLEAGISITWDDAFHRRIARSLERIEPGYGALYLEGVAESRERGF